jgi:hypothetical protein
MSDDNMWTAEQLHHKFQITDAQLQQHTQTPDEEVSDRLNYISVQAAEQAIANGLNADSELTIRHSWVRDSMAILNEYGPTVPPDERDTVKEEMVRLVGLKIAYLENLPYV